jgi:hypothetical protein
MNTNIEIGDHVKFSKIPPWLPPSNSTKEEIGVVIEIDNRFDNNMLTINPLTLANDAWYQRLPQDVQKMTESEVVMFKLSQ